MTTLLWLMMVMGGFTVILQGSSRAVTYATDLATGSRLPPFFVGITLLAVGTDLPEIANSIVSSYTDNGDINVGDSLGSTVTQLTLVLGLLPFLARSLPLGERGTQRWKGQQTTVWLTVIALLIVALLVLNDHIGRVDAVILITLWVAGSRLIYRYTRTDPQLDFAETVANRGPLIAKLILAAVAVGAGAALAVVGLTRLAELWGVSPFIIAFFGASIGTSLPELFVDATALRRGETGLAIGGVLGSSFVDATLSISIGPLLFPTTIDGSLALTGALVAAGAAAVVALVLGRGKEHNRRSGALLLLVYAVTWVVVLS